MKFIDKIEESVIAKMAESEKESIDEFVKKRQRILGKLKLFRPSFRKSQDMKRSWKLNKSRYLKPMKRFHKSTAGKRFHRQLGRFLALRAPLYKESYTGNGEYDVEGLVALSSLRTHLMIERGYVVPELTEHDLMLEFLELTDIHIGEVIQSVEENSPINEDSLELLTELCLKEIK